jgi:hypothetical protein
MDFMILSPDKRAPLLEKIPEMAQPDGILMPSKPSFST